MEERETALRFDNGLFSILGDAEEWQRSGERSAILKVLKDADEPMGPGEIASAAGMPGNNVRKLLFGMAKAGQVHKVRRGKYIHPDRADLATGNAGADDNVVEFPSVQRKPGNNGNNGNNGQKGQGNPGAAHTGPHPRCYRLNRHR